MTDRPCNHPLPWNELNLQERARAVRDRVLTDPDDPDLSALADAARAYLCRRHGYVMVIARDEPPCMVEFGIEGIGPAGFGKANDLADAICIAALRAAGARVHVAE